MIAPVHVREQLGVEGFPATETAEKTEYMDNKGKEYHGSEGRDTLEMGLDTNGNAMER